MFGTTSGVVPGTSLPLIFTEAPVGLEAIHCAPTGTPSSLSERK